MESQRVGHDWATEQEQQPLRLGWPPLGSGRGITGGGYTEPSWRRPRLLLRDQFWKYPVHPCLSSPLPSVYLLFLIVGNVAFTTEVFSSQRRSSELEQVPYVSRPHRSSPRAPCKVLCRHPWSVRQASWHVSATGGRQVWFSKMASREPTRDPGLLAAEPPPSAQARGLPGSRALCFFFSADILKCQGLQHLLIF